LTHNIRVTLWSAAAFLGLFLVFHAGIVVGSHQGLRPHGGVHGFRPPFGAPTGFILPDGYIPRGHGAVGDIATVTLPTLTIVEPNGDIETVLVATSTIVDGPGHAATSSSALRHGLRVIIFGDPDESAERINAKVIHVLP